MNTKRKYFQTAVYAAAVLLTFSSAAVASGSHAAMHESYNHEPTARLVPCNRLSNAPTKYSSSGIVVGFGETDPASELVLPGAVQREDLFAQVSGVAIGFTETDPAATAISSDAVVLQQTKSAGTLAMQRHSCQTDTINADKGTKMPVNCKC